MAGTKSESVNAIKSQSPRSPKAPISNRIVNSLRLSSGTAAATATDVARGNNFDSPGNFSKSSCMPSGSNRIPREKEVVKEEVVLQTQNGDDSITSDNDGDGLSSLEKLAQIDSPQSSPLPTPASQPQPPLTPKQIQQQSRVKQYIKQYNSSSSLNVEKQISLSQAQRSLPKSSSSSRYSIGSGIDRSNNQSLADFANRNRESSSVANGNNNDTFTPIHTHPIPHPHTFTQKSPSPSPVKIKPPPAPPLPPKVSQVFVQVQPQSPQRAQAKSPLAQQQHQQQPNSPKSPQAATQQPESPRSPLGVNTSHNISNNNVLHPPTIAIIPITKQKPRPTNASTKTKPSLSPRSPPRSILSSSSVFKDRINSNNIVNTPRMVNYSSATFASPSPFTKTSARTNNFMNTPKQTPTTISQRHSKSHSHSARKYKPLYAWENNVDEGDENVNPNVKLRPAMLGFGSSINNGNKGSKRNSNVRRANVLMRESKTTSGQYQTNVKSAYNNRPKKLLYNPDPENNGFYNLSYNDVNTLHANSKEEDETFIDFRIILSPSEYAELRQIKNRIIETRRHQMRFEVTNTRNGVHSHMSRAMNMNAKSNSANNLKNNHQNSHVINGVVGSGSGKVRLGDFSKRRGIGEHEISLNASTPYVDRRDIEGSLYRTGKG